MDSTRANVHHFDTFIVRFRISRVLWATRGIVGGM